MVFGRFSTAPAEPTLPRLTRLGAPTTPIDAAPQSFAVHNVPHPPLPVIDTRLPPLQPPQPGFAKMPSAPKSPSLHSSVSSNYSRRRSSADSDDGAPPSSRSSASTHDGYFKQFPWAAGLPSRKDSAASSEYSISPMQSPPPGRPILPPTQFAPASSRGPMAGQSTSRQMPDPRPQSPRVRPHPPQGNPSDPRAFLRTHSPPADGTFPRRMPEPQMPAYRLGRADSPVPAIERSQSPLARLREDTRPPPPLRATSSMTSISSKAAMSSFGGPGPAFAHPRMNSPPLPAHPAFPPTPLPTSRRATPPLRQNTPQLPPTPPMRPVSVSNLPLTDLEINTIWSHACLLFQNGKVADALTMMQSMNERPGADPVTLARLNINIGIMSEDLTSQRNDTGALPEHITQLMIEAFQTAVKHSPDGPEGALATFLLACTLFDTQDYYRAASCFEMCESIFAGEKENDSVEQRLSLDSLLSPGSEPTATHKEPGMLDGSESIDLSKLGMDYSLHLSTVQDNYLVAHERSRIPAHLGTSRGLQRIPTGLLLQEGLPGDPPALSPLPESDEEDVEDEGESIYQRKRSDTARATGMELPEIRLDLGPPGEDVPPMPMRRRTTKKQDREEMERRREARRTRLLIKLGDLRLNKPLPPLPHEREASRRQNSAPTPKVPHLPVASMVNGMPFV